MFNPLLPTWLHIDLNSCFATIEQQANPHLRGKPIAVCAYTTPRGCILAPSVEAKRFGVKTGMRVQDGKMLCPNLTILPSDPAKYRFVNRALVKLLNEYTPEVSVRSIDEMLLNFDPTVIPTDPDLAGRVEGSLSSVQWKKIPRLSSIARNDKITYLINTAHEIKQRIKSEIGEYLTVSIGISTNPYLAKLAAGLRKPDGLDEINAHNILHTLSQLKLTDLPYIKERNQARLNRVGIKTPVDFYFATTQKLKAAFQSIVGHYWYLRLHGYRVDEVEWERKTIGHSYALPKFTNNIKELEQLLCKLVEKMGRRLRENHLTTQGLHIGCNFSDGTYWHHGQKLFEPMYASQDLFENAKNILRASPLKLVRILAVSCFSLTEDLCNQMTLFTDENKKRALTQAMDRINDKWGEFSVAPATMLTVERQNKILDRIAFGRVLDIQDVSLAEESGLKNETYFH